MLRRARARRARARASCRPPVRRFARAAPSACQTGKAVLASMPARADVADALLAKCFSTPVAAFRAAAARALAPRKAHAELVATGEAVHALLVDGVADFRALEFWISTRVPPVSDGNNFGVEVQNYVIEQLKAYRVSLAALTEALATYHSSRAAALEKLGGAATTIETSAVESTESKVEEGKGKESKGSKLDKTTKTTTKEDSDDQRAHIVELDVRQCAPQRRAPRPLAAGSRVPAPARVRSPARAPSASARLDPRPARATPQLRRSRGHGARALSVVRQGARARREEPREVRVPARRRDGRRPDELDVLRLVARRKRMRGWCGRRRDGCRQAGSRQAASRSSSGMLSLQVQGSLVASLACPVRCAGAWRLPAATMRMLHAESRGGRAAAGAAACAGKACRGPRATIGRAQAGACPSPCQKRPPAVTSAPMLGSEDAARDAFFAPILSPRRTRGTCGRADFSAAHAADRSHCTSAHLVQHVTPPLLFK